MQYSTNTRSTLHTNQGLVASDHQPTSRFFSCSKKFPRNVYSTVRFLPTFVHCFLLLYAPYPRSSPTFKRPWSSFLHALYLHLCCIPPPPCPLARTDVRWVLMGWLVVLVNDAHGVEYALSLHHTAAAFAKANLKPQQEQHSRGSWC